MWYVLEMNRYPMIENSRALWTTSVAGSNFTPTLIHTPLRARLSPPGVNFRDVVGSVNSSGTCKLKRQGVTIGTYVGSGQPVCATIKP